MGATCRMLPKFCFLRPPRAPDFSAALFDTEPAPAQVLRLEQAQIALLVLATAVAPLPWRFAGALESAWGWSREPERRTAAWPTL